MTSAGILGIQDQKNTSPLSLILRQLPTPCGGDLSFTVDQAFDCSLIDSSMKVIQVSLILIMFSAAARAFSLGAVRPRPRMTLFRPMSMGSGPDTSVVDTCQQKIKDALEATDVKVVGK